MRRAPQSRMPPTLPACHHGPVRGPMADRALAWAHAQTRLGQWGGGRAMVSLPTYGSLNVANKTFAEISRSLPAASPARGLANRTAGFARRQLKRPGPDRPACRRRWSRPCVQGASHAGDQTPSSDRGCQSLALRHHPIIGREAAMSPAPQPRHLRQPHSFVLLFFIADRRAFR